MSLLRVSAGTTKGYGTHLNLSNSGGIEFGYSAHTITARPTPTKMAEFGKFESANTVTASSNNPNMSFQRFHVPAGISATRLDLLAAYSQAASTAGSYTMRFGFYTMSGSTAGTYATASGVVTHSSGGDATNAAGYSAQSGTQWRSFSLGTVNLTPGDYLLGVLASINGPAGSTGSMTMYGASAISLSPGGAQGVANPVGAFAGGIFSVGTASPPASIHISDVNRSGSYALAQPGFRLIGTF